MLSLLLTFLLIGFGAPCCTLLPGLLRTLRSTRWHEGQARLLALDLSNEHARYEFIVAGRRYRGDRLNTVGYLPQSARERFRNRTVGHTVPVWYDPRRPEHSALDRTSTLVAWIFGLGGAAALVGGCLRAAPFLL